MGGETYLEQVKQLVDLILSTNFFIVYFIENDYHNKNGGADVFKNI
jgi:hypothetical protein